MIFLNYISTLTPLVGKPTVKKVKKKNYEIILRPRRAK